MLTNSDKKFIADILNSTLDRRFKENNIVLDKKFEKIDQRFENIDQRFDSLEKVIKKNQEQLVKDMIDLFDVTNSRIDKVLEKLSAHDKSIRNLQIRTVNIEEKVFSISA